ncbi:hypothetical protein GGD81_003913 [Rhodobium orientis]|uniref:DUF1761 domain-containing protein n=1 Tax=Rhodobium orientis TaxID=34017 RepID=A0A327JMW7_9HYPH|nr:DUF1761 domain-containing protein [Rhodobium orientis]MBB4304848.1 hypothetical protein [Rhodobium orientis]MBK5949178.1 hypothetical protein [Rhodobium orientis]RAI27401.1 hypothetical protein CH339_10440 [Rhodobium orientis]
MIFAGINYLAVLAAAITGFVVGAVWYGILGRQWMAAAEIDPARLKGEGGGNPQKGPMLVGAAANLIMAFMLAGVIGHLGQDTVTVRNGVISAAFIWAGFVVTTLAVNYAFQGKKVLLTVIDGGHWLLVLLIQGALIGYLGV